MSVAMQEQDSSSVLSQVRRFLAWRRTQPALQVGAIAFFDAPEPILAFRRDHAGESRLVVFNLSAHPVRWPIPEGLSIQPIGGPGLASGELDAGQLQLPARGVYYARID